MLELKFDCCVVAVSFLFLLHLYECVGCESLETAACSAGHVAVDGIRHSEEVRPI